MADATAVAGEAGDLLSDLTVYDCEVHTMNPFPDIVDYIRDDEMREFQRNGYTIGPDDWGAIPWDGWDRRAGGRITQDTVGIESAEDYAGKCEEFGVDKVVFSPGLGFKTFQVPDGETRLAMMRAVNDLMVDRFVRDDDTNFAKMLVVPDHPRESAAEIERVGGEDGIVGVFSVDLLDYPIGHERYEPVLEAVEAADLPLMLHSESSVYAGWPTNGLEYDTFLELHTLVHPLLKLWHATSAIAQGIPERYDVDLVFMEAGQSWIQLLANRMDREYIERPHEAPLLEKLPSEYLGDFYFTTQPLEEVRHPGLLGDFIEVHGLEDRMCFTGDYPHYDFDSTAAIAGHDGLTREQKTKILQDNPARLFGI